MSGAVRDPDQADFDLERFIEMFDEALTSQDPRVINALRSLMMIVTLTRPEGRDNGIHDRNAGPLRRLYDDLQQRAKQSVYNWEDPGYPYEKYSMKAAAEMAQQVDQDVIEQMKAAAMVKVKGFYKK